MKLANVIESMSPFKDMSDLTKNFVGCSSNVFDRSTSETSFCSDENWPNAVLFLLQVSQDSGIYMSSFVRK